jgi:hypothetical protein
MSKLDELFQELPHGDRICKLYGICICGRDEAILNIKSWVFSETARLQAIEAAARKVLESARERTRELDALAAALEGKK